MFIEYMISNYCKTYKYITKIYFVSFCLYIYIYIYIYNFLFFLFFISKTFLYNDYVWEISSNKVAARVNVLLLLLIKYFLHVSYLTWKWMWKTKKTYEFEYIYVVCSISIASFEFPRVTYTRFLIFVALCWYSYPSLMSTSLANFNVPLIFES